MVWGRGLAICWCLWNKICMKYIWFDWGVFICFPNSHNGLYVQANIVTMCVSVCVCCTVCVCCQTMHDWSEMLCYKFAVESWSLRMKRRGRSCLKMMRKKDQKADGKTTVQFGVPAVMWGLVHEDKPTVLTEKQTSFLDAPNDWTVV